MPAKQQIICPACGSHDISKNGMTRRGKQNCKCRDCGQFVEESPMSLKTGCNPKSSATPRRFAPLGNAHQGKRVLRLMRKTLSFSKQLKIHIGAIGLFIDEYNCVIQKRLAVALVPLFPLSFPKKHYPLFIL